MFFSVFLMIPQKYGIVTLLTQDVIWRRFDVFWTFWPSKQHYVLTLSFAGSYFFCLVLEYVRMFLCKKKRVWHDICLRKNSHFQKMWLSWCKTYFSISRASIFFFIKWRGLSQGHVYFIKIVFWFAILFILEIKISFKTLPKIYCEVSRNSEMMAKPYF